MSFIRTIGLSAAILAAPMTTTAFAQPAPDRDDASQAAAQRADSKKDLQDQEIIKHHNQELAKKKLEDREIMKHHDQELAKKKLEDQEIIKHHNQELAKKKLEDQEIINHHNQELAKKKAEERQMLEHRQDANEDAREQNAPH